MIAPLLRAPPFHNQTIQLSRKSDAAQPLPEGIWDTLAQARVGGAFWDEPNAPDSKAAVVIRPAANDALTALLDPDAGRDCLWVCASRVVANFAAANFAQWLPHADPWSALAGADTLIAHGDDEWVAIARLCGVTVQLVSRGRFGAPGDSMATLDRRALEALSGASYSNPFTGQSATLDETIALLAHWRRLIDANRAITVATGMAWWKRDEIRRFLWVPGRKLKLVSRPERALAIARKNGGSIAIWPSRVSPSLLAKARQQGTALVRVEDGFVRSVGLGSNLVPPSSVVVDRLGIHFDPSGPSDLEQILAMTAFSPALEQRAAKLRETIVAAGVSKYGVGADSPIPARQANRRLVLVPAQVEDDMSVLAGGGGLHSNLELLRRVRALEPDAEIWFRPHPDVEAGHRKGAVPREQVLEYADRIVADGGMAPLLGVVDAVHVLTSLTGFEALLRGCEVVCHGTPFFAGWGLTRDLAAVPERRGRALSLDQLVAGVLIVYPRYLDPVSGLPCPPEVLVGRMADMHAPNRLGWVAPLRRWQGWFMARWRWAR